MSVNNWQPRAARGGAEPPRPSISKFQFQFQFQSHPSRSLRSANSAESMHTIAMDTPLHADLDLGAFVIDSFESAASSSPSAIAILCEDGTSITYFELNAVANEVAEWLVQMLSLDQISEFQQTPMVGLLMDRTIAILAMMLGVHKAGCAYVPVDPAFPPDRQQYILEHSRCNVLIVDKECYDIAKSAGLEIPAKHILMSDHRGQIISGYDQRGALLPSFASICSGSRVSSSAMQLVRKVNKHPEALAYVLYTSGSTGKPKGVAVKHVGVANIIRYFADELHVGPTCKIMGLTTFCFDISVLETFVPLTRGAAIMLATGATRRDPFRIIELLQEHRINVFQATPTTYEMMMATGWQGDASVQFLVGGEAFRPSLLPLAKKCAALLNVYGPTETTIWSTCFRVRANFEAYAAQMQIGGVPIGEAISETQLYLVSEAQPWKEVAPGEEGELFIGGTGVAAGYMHAPHLTSEKFIPNPFGGSGCVYRTGDVVRRLPDGNYFFVRRLDDQVKIDGFRIELEEIEKVFMQADEVEQAVALVRENKLVLYVKLVPAVAVTAALLPSVADPATMEEVLSIDTAIVERARENAARHLTYYMMPKHIVIVRDFTKTPNGKLDKKALATPRELQLELLQRKQAAVVAAETVAVATLSDALIARAYAEDDAAPRTLSTIICDAVEQLRGKRPHPSSSLGAFGLDSLGSVMLMRQLGTALHGEVKLRMQDLFAPGVTIRDVGQSLFNKASEGARSRLHLSPEPLADDLEACKGDADGAVDVPDYFGASLLANKRLFEGLRGVFTFMVLWDHWHNHSYSYNPAINVDTTLFFLISGYTTASQTRALPEVTKAGAAMELAPKGRFPLSNFWLVRAVGLYPILWLALILYGPMWHQVAVHNDTDPTQCVFLYIAGLGALGPCLMTGPRLRYATSLIINFIVYGLVQWQLTRLLNIASTRWANASDLCSSTQAFTSSTPLHDPRQSWRNYIGKFSLYVNYNIYHPEVFWKVLAAVLVSVLGLFVVIAQFHPKFISDVWFFFAGSWFLTLSEMWCGQRIAAVRASTVSGRIPPEDLSTPWELVRFVFDGVLKRTGASLVLGAIRQRLFAAVPTSSEHGSDKGVRTLRFFSLEGDTLLEKALLLLWRFSPDLLVVGMGIELSCTGDLCRTSTTSFAKYSVSLVIPFLVMVFVVISVHQRGLARHNISRLCLESAALNLLGYCSYPAFLLQSAFLGYYFTFIFRLPGYHFHADQPGVRHYFANIPLGYRFLAVIVFIAICWIIQKYFQDGLVTNAFSQWLAKSSQEAKKAESGDGQELPNHPNQPTAHRI